MLEGGAETMSDKIDQRIVEMSFENHKFEDGIAKSKNSLKQFADSLKNMGGGKDFTGLENSVQSVSSSFSMLEQIGIGALRRIGEAAVNTGGAMLKHLAIDPLTMGWTKYEQKTASVQTIMNATGKSIEEVNGYLGKLMWFSDETSYGFTDMTAALAQMTSSGGDIESLIPMITGVANATAYAGKGAAEFTRVMYNLNQSYGRGNLEYMDWKSLELAGVGGKELKQIFIDTGKAMGVLNAEGKTAKGTLVDIGTFGTTLSEKWANTKVMEAAFGKFSELSEEVYKLVSDGTFDTAAEAMESLAGKYSLVAEKAFKSAQQAKSFKEAINATLDATSSGWMRTYEIIFGELDEATRNFTQLSKILWTVFAAGAEGRNIMLKAIKDGGGIESIFQTLKNAGVALLKPLKAISQAFDQFFPPRTKDQWLGIIGVLETVSKRLIITDETAQKIQRTFAGFFAVLDIGWQTVKFLGSALYEIVDVFIPLTGSIFDMTASVGDFLVMMNHLIKETGIFQYGLLGIKVVAMIVRDAISSIIGKIVEFVNILWTTDKPLEYLGKTVLNVFKGVFDTLKTIITWISGKFVGAMSGVQKALGVKLNFDSEGTIGAILAVLKDFVDFLVGGGTDGIVDFGAAIKNLDFSRIATFVVGGTLLLFINQLTNLTRSMANVLTSTDGFVTGFSKKLFGVTTKIKDLAYVFGILTASLYVLSRIPWEDMKKGLKGLAGAIGLFVAAYASIQAITVMTSKAMGGLDVVKSTFTLVQIAAGVAIMALALSQISKIKEEDVWKSVGVMAAMMALLVSYQALSGLISTIPKQTALSISFAGMTFGLFGLVAVVALLSMIPEKSLKNGLAKMAVAIVMIAGIQGLFAVAARLSGGHTLGLNLLAIAGGILALIGVMKILALVNSREITQGIGNAFLLGGALAAIQLMFNIAGRVGGGVKFRTNIFAMQMGIVSMIALIAILGTIKDQTKIQNGIKTIAKMAGIIAALEILTALAARIDGGNKLQRILGSVSLTMLSFVALIAILSIPTQETINRGLLNISKMLGIIVAFEVLSSITGLIGNSVKGLGAIVGMVSALLVVTASLLLLSMIDQTALRKATTSLAMAVIAIGIMAVGLGGMTSSLAILSTGLSGLKAIVLKLIPGFVAMGIIILATLGLLKVITLALPLINAISWSSLAKFAVGLGLITTLVTAFTILSKVPGLSGGMGLVALVPGFAAMIAVVAAAAGLFGVMNMVLPIVDKISWNSFGKFVTGLGLIGVLAVGFALLGPVLMLLGTGFVPALGGALVAIAGAGLLIGAFAVLASVMDLLDADILISGMDKLVLVGEGLGRFVGSIVGGFNAEALIGYGVGLAGFADAISQINPGSFEGAESLARALLVLTGVAVLDGLSKFVNSGKNPGEVFGEQLKGLIQSFKGITAEDVTRTTSVIASLAPMSENLKKLAEATQSIPNSGGLLGNLLGNNDIDDFGKQIRAFVKGFEMIYVAEAQHTSNVLVALAPMMVNLKAFAKAAGNIPNSGGFIGSFLGENDVHTFGKMLAGFVDVFQKIGIAAAVHTTGVLAALTPMAINLETFALAANTIPNSGGFLERFLGGNDIDTFGAQIAGLVGVFGNLDQTVIANASTALLAMSNNMLPGLIRFTALTESVGETGNWERAIDMTNFAGTLKQFVKTLSGIDTSVVAPALKSLEAINESFKVVGAEVIASALASFENNKKPFQSAIVGLLNETIKMIDSKKMPVAASFSAIFINALAKSRTYITDFKELGSDLVKGLKNGIQAEQGSATAAIDTMTKKVITTTTRGFQINSPSKIFEGIGKWLPISLGNGIKSNANVAILASVNMAEGVEKAMRDTSQIHSQSPLYFGAGKWIPKSWGAGIESGKASLLKTASDLGLDTADISLKGMAKKIGEGEGAVTSGINSLLELLTGEKSIADVADQLGAKTGNTVTDGMAAAIGSSASKQKVGKSVAELAEDAFQEFQKQMSKLTDYDLITPEVEIARWEEFSKKYAEGTETRLKADKKLNELKFNYSKTWIDREKYYKRLSLEEELAAWTRVQAKYKAGHEYRLQAERELFRVKQEISQLEYQNAMDWIDEEKYYGRLNPTQELKKYKQIQNAFEKTSDERKKIDREVFRLENEIRDANLAYEEKLKTIETERTDKRIQAEEEYYSKTKEVNDKLKSDIQSLNDEYENAVKSRTQTLYSAWGIFDKVDPFEAVSGEDLLGNLEDQVVAFDQWQAQISALSAKGVDEGLIEELRAMGPKALPQILALSKMTDSELTMYVALWQKKSREAKDQAVDELQGMKEETNLKIEELTEEADEKLRDYKRVWKSSLRDINRDAKTQLNQLEEDWIANLGGMTAGGISVIQQFRLDWFGELAAMVSDTRNQMAELQRLTKNAKAFESVGNSVRDAVSKIKPDVLGKSIASGFANGARSNVGLMVGAGTFMTNTLIGVVKKNLGINSPSKEFMKFGQYSNEGLAEGLRRFSGLVYAEGKSMGQTALEAVSLSMNAIPDLLGSDVDTFTITPVLDLTNVKSGMYDMNSLFNSASGLDLGGTMELLPAAGGANQNGILNAIKDSLLAVTNPEVDLSGVLTVQVVNDKGEIVSIAETAIKDILRRESR